MTHSSFTRGSRWISFPARRGGGVSGIPALLVIAATIVLVQPPLASGEESPYRQDPDRLMIRGGYAGIFGSTTTVTFEGVGGLGSTVNLQTTLGSNSRDAFRIDGLYRFNRRHSVGFSWYRVLQSGNAVIDEDITIRDTLIDVGANTQTSLNINLFRLFYNWSFYNTDRMELAFSPGIYFSDIDLDFYAAGQISSGGGALAAGTYTNSETIALPLPSVGFLFNYYITPKLLGQFRSDFFYLAGGEFYGSMFEFYAGLEYRLFKYFAAGVAYDRLQVDVSDDTSDGLRVALAYNVIYLYGTLYAFDTPL